MALWRVTHHLPSFLKAKHISRPIVSLGILSIVAVLAAGVWVAVEQNRYLKQQVANQQSNQDTTQGNANQIELQNKTLLSQKDQLQDQIDQLQATANQSALAPVQEVYGLYSTIQTKVDRNNSLKLDTASVTTKYSDWGKLLLDKKYDELKQTLTAATSQLDQQYQAYQQTQAAAAKSNTANQPPSGNNGGGGGGNSGGSGGQVAGYTAKTVATSRGSFAVKMIQLPLSQYTVKTVSGSATDCTNNCGAKSLAQYVADNGAYAGINGTYFCPPDYASCSGKTYSYDFALYNSNSGNWINAPARSWDSTGLITFNGSSAQAYKVSANYGGQAVTAAISNFPPLIVYNNQINSNEADQSAAQKAKNYKGALGINGSDIFLVTASGVSMTDLAYVMQALGATSALNLDGGGSGALYIGGSYKVGPGRLLPNAIVLVKK